MIVAGEERSAEEKYFPVPNCNYNWHMERPGIELGFPQGEDGI